MPLFQVRQLPKKTHLAVQIGTYEKVIAKRQDNGVSNRMHSLIRNDKY